MKNLLKTCQGPPSQRRYCTSPHGRHAFGHFTKTILRICQKNAGAPPSQCRHCTSPGSRNSLAFQTSHFVREFSRQVPGSHDRDADFKRAILSENLQEKCWGIDAQTLHEPARSQCTGTLQNSNFARESTRKMPGDRYADTTRARAVAMHWDTPKKQFVLEST